MILVAGGTGVLGGAIARRLLAGGKQVRVLTRRRERAQSLQEVGAEVAVGDLRDRRALDAACGGATHVISTANAFVGTGEESVQAVDERGNRHLIDAARAAGVRQFVFTSALVPDTYRAIDYFAAKFATEEYLRASGLTWTILRPTAFMETWAQIIGEPLVRTGSTKIFGSGLNPLNFVAVDDVATIAVMTMDRPDACNAFVDIGGPENLTLLDVAAIFERVTGRTGTRAHLPVPILRLLGTLVRPFNPVFARQVRAGALMAAAAQPFDPAPMLAKYPVKLTRLEEWVRARYGPEGSSPGRS
jgi:NADH dehydrogenase